MPRPPGVRVKGYLRELNMCRRLWQSWNDYLPNEIDPKPSNPAIKYKVLLEEIRFSLLFRIVVRLYALMEPDENKFTFGYWLNTLNQTPKVKETLKKYKLLLKSEDFKKVLKNRHNSYAHNSIKDKHFGQTYKSMFKLNEVIEELYDQIVSDGQAEAIPWSGAADTHVWHPSNCPGGFEENVREFFIKFNS